MAGQDTQPDVPACSQTLSLGDPVRYAPGIGPRRAVVLQRMGIRTVGDLLKHLPLRWEELAGQVPIGQLAVGTIATVVGEITTCRYIPPGGRWRPGPAGGKGRFVVTIEDATCRLEIVWFNGGYLRQQLHPGLLIEVTGKVETYDDHRQMVNPRWRLLEPGRDHPAARPRLRPVYPASEDLTSAHLDRAIQAVLPAVLDQIEDHFDADYRSARHLPELRQAYRMLHAPHNLEETAQARRRLAYDELLLLQLALAVRRHHATCVLRAPALRSNPAIDRHIRSHFPFELTDAQNRVIQDIAADLATERPMNRLLQGDVGSGKTVVALYAMLLAVACGKQAAMMAPTELLAEQHLLSIADMLAGSNVRLGLLTGSLSPAQRSALLDDIQAGRVDIVIGTHALLTGSVRFADLAVAVVDEQHRFGVLQRAALRCKTDQPLSAPHCLVMTATPIPRTLGLTLFGDLDISTIDALPPGRPPIRTHLLHPRQAPAVYRRLARRLDDGHQAYVVVPAIEQGPMNLTTVTDLARRLQDQYLPGHRVAALHGRMPRDRRQALMDHFRRGRIHVLVATTVIEVGVDVPNASLMVIEHAERFGLAQLHQLRGRIGRGSRQSHCILLADPPTDQARRRLQALVDTTDGFQIAEADFDIRGMGEIVGTRQSGLPPLRLACLPADMDLLQMARRDARTIVSDDPTLARPDHRLLRARLLKQFGPMLGLGDVA